MSDETRTVAKARLQLLMYKYARGLDASEEAELKRLTARLHVLSPRVTEAQREIVKQMQSDIK